MATNRYTNLSFGPGLNNLPLIQLPFEALDQTISQLEQRKTATDMLSETSPKYIQESRYDTELSNRINDYQQKVKSQLVDIAKTGDKNKYVQALSEAQAAMAQLWRPGGEAYNLQKRHEQYQKHVATEQERLSKNEITPYQYQQSVKEPLNRYDASKGQSNLNLLLKPQAINFDKFAEGFLKNYSNTDLMQKGNFRVINGRMVYDDQKVSGIKAQEVLKDLTAAYNNAAIQTGQLNDMFDVMNQDNKLTQEYAVKQTTKAKSLLDLVNNTDLNDSAQVRNLQKSLVDAGIDIGEIDSKAGPKTKAGIERAKQSADEVLQNLSAATPQELTQDAKEGFIFDYINSLATPYAQSKATQTSTRKFTDFHQTLDRVEAEARARKKVDEEGNPLIVSSIPSSKLIPEDMGFYAKNGELRKNTNASADITSAIGKAMSATNLPINGYLAGKVYGVISFFDHLFTKNDRANLNNPVLKNIQDHLSETNPEFNSYSDDKKMELVSDAINSQTKESLQGQFTGNLNSKFKENFDKIFTDTKFDKDSDVYNSGLMANFKFTVPDKKKGAVIISGKQLADRIKEGDYGKTVKVSYKGSVDDWTSPLPYGSTVFSIGDEEAYMEPDAMSQRQPEAWANGLYRAKVNAEVGWTSHFKYFGTDYEAIYKPDGTYSVKPVGQDVWETYGEAINPNTGEAEFVKEK